MLGRPEEAAEHIQAAIAAHVEEAGEGSEGGMVASLQAPTARALLHVNLASVAAMQGAVAKAEENMAAALKCHPGCQAAQLMSAYLRLVQGQQAEALALLRLLHASPPVAVAAPPLAA